jgi:hypothetical protein
MASEVPIRQHRPGAVFINKHSNHYRLKRLRPEQLIRPLRLQYDGTEMFLALQHASFGVNLKLARFIDAVTSLN